MQVSLENFFELTAENKGFKGVTYNNVHYLNNTSEDEEYVTFKISDVSQIIPRGQNISNKLIINRELWLAFNPIYSTKNITSQIIAIKLIFLSKKYPIELFLIMTVKSNKKLLIHITNSHEYCYIRSNNKFLISRTNRGVEGNALSEIYSHINVIYSGVDNNVKNSAFFPSLINTQETYDNSSEFALALTLYPSLAQSQINQLKFKKEILYNLFTNHKVDNPLCYHSECGIDVLLERLNDSGILTTIRSVNTTSNEIEIKKEKEPKFKSELKSKSESNQLQSLFAPLVSKYFNKQKESDSEKEIEIENDNVNDNANEKIEFEACDENKNDEVSFLFKIKPKNNKNSFIQSKIKKNNS